MSATDTGFYYLQSRYYDPAIGRFLDADVYTSTGQGLLGCNMFAYCRNNPVSRIDVSGTDDTICLDADNNRATKEEDWGKSSTGSPLTPTVGQGGGAVGYGGRSNSGQEGMCGGPGLDRPVSPRQINKSTLKNVDVHAFKGEYVRDDGKRWDLYKDTANKATIWLGNKAQTIWIQTEYILEELLEYFQKGRK